MNGTAVPKYPENLIHFCRPVLEHYELEDEMGRMFVRSMSMRNRHPPSCQLPLLAGIERRPRGVYHRGRRSTESSASSVKLSIWVYLQ